MCTTCGCSAGRSSKDAGQKHAHADEHHHSHEDAHDHHHEHDHQVHPHQSSSQNAVLDFGQGPTHSHAPGVSQTRMVQVEQDILSGNDAIAGQNRRLLCEREILALNLVSSPGAGKTTLLIETLKQMTERPCAVIEGDQQTSNDADRIRATGVPAIQINTGKGCHLDAQMVAQAIARLAPERGSALFIENVGNLVCPASFDLGESFRVAILSVPEGDDKPLKYPDIFANADLMIINKIDLLPYVEFDLDACVDNARRVNPQIECLALSATSGEGLDLWLAWLGRQTVSADGE